MISFRIIFISLCLIFFAAPAHAERPNSKRVYSTEYLEALCKRMASRVGLNSAQISILYDDACMYANVTRESTSTSPFYTLRINSDFADNLSRDELVAVVGHELMHIAHGDLDPNKYIYQPLSRSQRRIVMGVLGLCVAGMAAKKMHARNMHGAITSSAAIAAGSAGGYLLAQCVELIRHMRFYADMRTCEAYADSDAVQKFHCAKGLISLFEKWKSIHEQSCASGPLFQRIKYFFKYLIFNTHPVHAKRIAAVKKLVPAA